MSRMGGLRRAGVAACLAALLTAPAGAARKLSAPEAESKLVRQADGVQWVVLFNQDRGSEGTLLSAAVEPHLREALAQVRDWPELDLFELR